MAVDGVCGGWPALRGAGRRDSRSPHFELVLILLIALIVPIAGLVVVSDLKAYSGAVASTMFGVFYIGFAFSWIIPLRFGLGVGWQLTILLFLVVWAEDIFAYAAGRMIGRVPLAKLISPRKTV